MQYSSKLGGLAPVDFLMEIKGLKIDQNQLFIPKKGQFEDRNSKNGEIDVFADCFQWILMGFLTKKCQNDFTLLES